MGLLQMWSWNVSKEEHGASVFQDGVWACGVSQVCAAAVKRMQCVRVENMMRMVMMMV